MSNHKLAAHLKPSPRSQGQTIEPQIKGAEAQYPRARQSDPLAGVTARLGGETSPGAHVVMLKRATAAQPVRATHSLLQLQRQYGNQYVQRVVALARETHGETKVTPDVEEAIQGERSGGQVLDSGVRAHMESAMGVDFTGVRVHTNTTADTLNHALNARAFTTGQDIFFRHGEYHPEQVSGRKLLAHELTHVVQQASGKLQYKKGSIGPPGDRYEQEAERVAEQITAQEPTQLQSFTPSPSAIQRQVESGDEEMGSGNEDTQSVVIDEDLFEEDDEQTVQMMPEPTLSPIIQRQPNTPDIPPPPPAFPSVYDWFFDIFDDTVGLWNLTCEDRCERGFYVMWNEEKNKSFAGDVAMGEPAKGAEPAHIELGDKPPARKPIYPVGMFHTHPPAPPGYRKKGVGPSEVDKNTAKNLDLPGLVEDFMTPTSGCKKSGFYFFGPTRRGY